MIYQVMHNDDVIGTSRLECRDSGMAIAFGRFYPSPAYDAVRPVSHLFTGAVGDHVQRDDQNQLSQYYAARDALGLRLVSSDEQELATGYIHIVDWEGDDELELHAQVADQDFWQAIGDE